MIDPRDRASLQEQNERLREQVAALQTELEAARTKFQWMENLLEQSTIPICLWQGDDYVCTFANRAYLAALGKQDVLGKRLRTVFDAHEILGLLPVLDQAYASGQVQVVQEALVKLRHPETGDLEERWFNLICNPVRNEQGVVAGVSHFVIDVTAQVQARQTLYQQAQILEQVSGSVIVTDLQGVIISWNRDSSRIFGYASEEALGASIATLYPAAEQAWLRFAAITATPEPDNQNIETTGCTKTGEHIPLQLCLSLLRDDSDTPIGVIGYAIDISERKQLENYLHIFQAVAEQSPECIMFATNDPLAQRRAIYTNSAFTTLLGYAADHDAFTIPELIAPEDQDRLPQINEQVMRDGHWQGTLTLLRKDGAVFPALISIFLVRNQEGMPIMRTVTVQDITEQQQQERDLRIFKTLVENAVDGIGMADTQGRITYANAAYGTLSGYGQALLGRSLDQLYEIEMAQIGAIVQQVTGQGFWMGKLSLRHTSGTIIPVQVSVFPVADDQGQLQGTVAMVRDITEQLRAEEERAALQQQVIDAQHDALRELSTPLIPITDEVLIMPLIGTIDSRRAQQIMETLLAGVAHHQADLVILDITGVAIVDTQVAQAFIQAAQAIQLLGAKVMLTGIQPQIAQTLVHLGLDLGNIQTRGSLQAGIEAALARN
ncbi:MAG: PAS domain S-box protein [Chloroflexales bacterium]|nr:PAS domain S-box protein [Chloroflexales bacterium]